MSAHGTPVPMTARRAGPLRGEVRVPGDKSISHRALILGRADRGRDDGDGASRRAGRARHGRGDAGLRGRGRRGPATAPGRVHGVGVGGFAEPSRVIDCGNSGTGVRLIMGAMATSPITATFTGDASL